LDKAVKSALNSMNKREIQSSTNHVVSPLREKDLFIYTKYLGKVNQNQSNTWKSRKCTPEQNKPPSNGSVILEGGWPEKDQCLLRKCLSAAGRCPLFVKTLSLERPSLTLERLPSLE
jgi:hypothetical protein